MEEIETILQEASLDEKLKLLGGIPMATGVPAHLFSPTGSDFWDTQHTEHFSIPKIRTSDAPNGVRGVRFFHGDPGACIPEGAKPRTLCGTNNLFMY
jgi:beta-glucosidase